jgi:hypothetical protein
MCHVIKLKIKNYEKFKIKIYDEFYIINQRKMKK